MQLNKLPSNRAFQLRHEVERNAAKVLQKDGFREDRYYNGRPLSKDLDRRTGHVHLSNDFGQRTTSLRLDDSDFVMTHATVSSLNGAVGKARIATEDIYEPSSQLILEKGRVHPWSKTVEYRATQRRSEGPLGLQTSKTVERAVFDSEGNLVHYEASLDLM